MCGVRRDATFITLLVVGCTLFAMGCAPALDEPRHAGAGDDVPSGVSLALVTRSDQGVEHNVMHHPLHTGDQLALWLASASPRFAYVVNVAPTGEAKLVASTVVHGSERIPCHGWFQLAPPSGQELVAVIMTRAPLHRSGDPMPHVTRLLAATQARTDLAKIQSRKPPAIDADGGYASMGFRGESLRIDGSAIRSLDDDDEVVVLIDIDHRALTR